MSYTDPFTQPGHWYRGNLHTHTTASDGVLTVEERCAAYRAAGYDFLVITDHRRIVDILPPASADFLPIAGSELHPTNPRTGDLYHLVAIDVHEPIDAAALSANDVIEAIHRQGGLAVLAHPYWSGLTLLDMQPLRGYFAVEVYNDTCRGIGKEFSESSWDELLDNVGPVLGVAVDDAHDSVLSCFHGWIMLKAPALAVEDIKTALRTGAFYATTGPQFTDIILRETPEKTRELTIACSPVQTIVVKGQRNYGWRQEAADGETLTGARYQIPLEMHYLRVEITDAQGKRAWSNPYMLNLSK